MQPDNLISHRSLDELESDLISRAARINAEEYLFLCDVREFDLRQGWAAYHFNNCAEWLGWRCQLSSGAARERVRVANQLFCLPLISEAFRQGRIGYCKARALTRIAEPDNEQELLDYALNRTTSQVEQHCKALRNARRELSTADANQAYRSRYLSARTHSDGTMTLNAELPQELGELVMKAIEIALAADNSDDHDVTAEPEAWSARQADALVAVAKGYLAGGADKPAGNSDNYAVMVHVDAEALAGKNGESSLPIETIRRLTCDGSLITVIEDEHGNPLNAGHKQRTIPLKVRRALAARDKVCKFPGCMNSRYLEGHHIVHWADGGETNVNEMVRLCSRHHRLHHEGGYTVHKLADGRFVFRNADGRLIPEAPPYRAADDDEIDDATYNAFIEKLAARHVSREMCEDDSCESRDVMKKNSYISRDAFEDGDSDRVREPVARYFIGVSPLGREHISLPI